MNEERSVTMSDPISKTKQLKKAIRRIAGGYITNLRSRERKAEKNRTDIGPDVSYFRPHDGRLLRVVVAVPVLSTSVDDPAVLALQHIAEAAIGSSINSS